MELTIMEIMEDTELFLEYFKRYLEERGYSKSTIITYLRSIRRLIQARHLTTFDLVGVLDRLIEEYSRGGRSFTSEDHGNTVCALKRLKEFYRAMRVKGLYISYQKGYSSWRPTGIHYSEYIIDEDTIKVTYDMFFTTGVAEVTARLEDAEIDELVGILKIARRYDLFSPSCSQIMTVHGSACTYHYQYAGADGSNCGSLFKIKDSKICDSLHERYNALIKNITDRLAPKTV